MESVKLSNLNKPILSDIFWGKSDHTCMCTGKTLIFPNLQIIAFKGTVSRD